MTSEPVPCQGCGHGYPDHEADGGHCTAAIGTPLVPLSRALPCPCPGFRWVDPAGPATGYHRPPQRP